MPFLAGSRVVEHLRGVLPSNGDRASSNGQRDPTAAPDLAAYLRDHFADAGSAARLASRVSRYCRATPRAATFHELAAEIARDRDVLLRLLVRFDGRRASRQGGVGRIGDVAEALPLESENLTAPDGALLSALETLNIAVAAKAGMWLTLRRVQQDYRILAELDLERLIVRAARQSRVLEQERINASIRAFSLNGPAMPSPDDGARS